jgi:hypothetical protein
MAFVKVLLLNSSAGIGGIPAPGGDVTALGSVCDAPLRSHTAALRLVRFS